MIPSSLTKRPILTVIASEAATHDVHPVCREAIHAIRLNVYVVDELAVSQLHLASILHQNWRWGAFSGRCRVVTERNIVKSVLGAGAANGEDAAPRVAAEFRVGQSKLSPVRH